MLSFAGSVCTSTAQFQIPALAYPDTKGVSAARQILRFAQADAGRSPAPPSPTSLTLPAHSHGPGTTRLPVVTHDRLGRFSIPSGAPLCLKRRTSFFGPYGPRGWWREVRDSACNRYPPDRRLRLPTPPRTEHVSSA